MSKSYFVNKFAGLQIKRNLWRMATTLQFYSAKRGEFLEVKEGFETNLASIEALRYVAPVLYALLVGYGNASCALHDSLYAEKRLSRKECDDVLREALVAEGVGCFRAWIFYAGVRLFGARFYDK